MTTTPSTPSTSVVSGIAERAARLWFDGYRMMPHPVSDVTFGVVKPAEPVTYWVNVRTETCSCPAFGRWRTCKHCSPVLKAVLKGYAPGLPAEELAEFYNPSLMANAELSPDLDTTTDTDTDTDTADVLDMPVVTPPVRRRWADMPKNTTDFFQPCPICGQPVPKGSTCFRVHGASFGMTPVSKTVRGMDWAN